MTTKTFTQKNSTNVKLFVLFISMFLSNSAFSQENIQSLIVEEKEEIIINSEDAVASTVEFATWFIGNVKSDSKDKTAPLSLGRKQLINAGIITNKVLIKTVLKKVIGQESSIV